MGVSPHVLNHKFLDNYLKPAAAELILKNTHLRVRYEAQKEEVPAMNRRKAWDRILFMIEK